jgi:hypothetical protein
MVPLTGCAASTPLVFTQAVGPARIVAVKKAPSGELLVYSGWERFDTLDTDHQKHTPYTLRSAEQSKPIHVINSRGSFGEEPEAVALPPGRYIVEAVATNLGRVHVPVVIREGERTVVYLDGESGPSASGKEREANWVRRPDGSIVGWADTTGTK